MSVETSTKRSRDEIEDATASVKKLPPKKKVVGIIWSVD